MTLNILSPNMVDELGKVVKYVVDLLVANDPDLSLASPLLLGCIPHCDCLSISSHLLVGSILKS